MIIAYFDESGDDGYPAYSSPLFTLSCVYIDAEHWNDAFTRIQEFRRRIKAKYDFPMKWEMHMTKFLTNKNPYQKLGMDDDERLALITWWCAMIAALPVKMVNVVINKPRIVGDYDVLDRAVNYMVQRIENDVVKTRAADKFLVITDEGRVGKMRNTTRKMTRHNYIPSKYGEYSYSRLIKCMIEDPLPKESRQSHFIQIADIVAYIVYMHKLLELEVGQLHNRMPPQVIAQGYLGIWLDILKPSLNLHASKTDEYGIVCYPK